VYVNTSLSTSAARQVTVALAPHVPPDLGRNTFTVGLCGVTLRLARTVWLCFSTISFVAVFHGTNSLNMSVGEFSTVSASK
jgi:hypothetical protein